MTRSGPHGRERAVPGMVCVADGGAVSCLGIAPRPLLLRPSEILLIPPGTSVRLIPRARALGLSMPGFLEVALAGSVRRLGRRQLAGLEWLPQALAFAAKRDSKGAAREREVTDGLLRLLAERLLPHPADGAETRGGTHAPWLGPLLRAVASRLGDPWTVDALAREAGLSRSLFADRFAREMGVTPMRYLLEQRMQAAERQLDLGTALREVARRAGYGSESAFSTAFKRWCGRTPGSLRAARSTRGSVQACASTPPCCS